MIKFWSHYINDLKATVPAALGMLFGTLKICVHNIFKTAELFKMKFGVLDKANTYLDKCNKKIN